MSNWIQPSPQHPVFTPGEFPRVSEGNLTSFWMTCWRFDKGRISDGAFSCWRTIGDKYSRLHNRAFQAESQTIKKLPITHLFLETHGSHWRCVHHRPGTSLKEKALSGYICGCPQGTTQLYWGISGPGYHCSSDMGVWMQCSEHVWYCTQVALGQPSANP